MTKVTAIVPAAGRGLRFAKKKGQRKPFFFVRGKPILIHTLLALEGSKCLDNIIVAVHRDDVTKWRDIVKRFGLKRISAIVPGGKTRFESVKRGLSFVGDDSDIVLIHDGVRPLVDKRLLSDSIKACDRFGAAVCGVPVLSTVKFIQKGSTVKNTPDRRSLYAAQTPQVFKKDIILRAYNRTFTHPPRVTDDSMLVERLGYKVKIVPGSYENIKVTTPQDLILVGMILSKRRKPSAFNRQPFDCAQG